MFAFKDIKYDFVSGIVVSLVAIPLCLGIALASGAPLFSGILSGIIGGIIVGAISQSSVSVSGPAAGMIAVVIAAISALGGFQGFLLALLIAGILQILIGAFKAGFIGDYVPSNVIQGLLAAIGVLIIIKQLPLAFGYFAQNESLMESLKISQETLTIAPLTHMLTHINFGATIITIISLLLLIYWKKIPFKKIRAIPAPIVVVVLGVIINEIYQLFWPNLTLFSSHLVNLPISDSFDEFFKQFKMPNFADLTNYNVYVYAVMIAIVASLETLLNLEAAEKIDKRKRYSSRNRELVAQGVGNTLAGLLGGIVITSVIVRTSVNIQAGSRTKFSTIFHGFLLLIAVMLIPNWMNYIPLASLAAILIHTGYKLSSVSLYKQMYKEGFAHFFPFVITIVAIVFTNLLAGILIGLGVSFFFILKYNSQRRVDIIEEQHPHGKVYRLELPQQVSFLNKAGFISELRALPASSQVVLDASNTDYIDYDILEVLKEFSETHANEKDISLNMIGFKKRYDIHDHIDFINVTTRDVQADLDPQKVLYILKEGNQRFIENRMVHKNLKQQIIATSNSQHPMAVVLGCIDSRVPVEIIFDLGIGDAFIVRVAGNVGNKDILGSIEYAVEVAGAKLIVVLGHKGCGAIKAACDGVELGHVTELIKKIEPAITAETETKTNRHGGNDSFVANVTKINIENTKNYLYGNSVIIKKLIDDGQVGLIGALYDISTGKVEFEVLNYKM